MHTRLLTFFLTILLLVACSSKVKVENAPVADHSYIDVSIENDPSQDSVDIPDWTQNGYKIHALAKYELKARILSVERYRSGRESDLSPVDFALGWGPMSKEANLDKIQVSQSGRWYHWHADHLPISLKEIEYHSANTHIIPATAEIEKEILHEKEGDIVKMRGYLVKLNANDGWTWKSSLSRTDTGGGACELFWVNKLDN